MKTCPHCGSKNMEGADLCDRCQHSLTDMSRPQPGSSVERDLLTESIALLASTPPLTVGPEEPVGEVLKKMVAESIGCVIVVEGDHLLGIFTERDALLKLNVDAARLSDQPISSVMTANPITLAAKDKIAFALHKMNVGGYRHVPILTQGKLTGVISIRDILAYLTRRIV